MKYLRRIFEKRLTEDEILELREECETYLAYLLDDGEFEIDFAYGNVLSSFLDIDIRKNEVADDDQFLWNHVKDQVIPLIELFRKGHFKYNLEKVVLYYADGAKREIRNDEDLDKVHTLKLFQSEPIICLTIKIKI
jgi:hypothetical protein